MPQKLASHLEHGLPLEVIKNFWAVTTKEDDLIKLIKSGATTSSGEYRAAAHRLSSARYRCKMTAQKHGIPIEDISDSLQDARDGSYRFCPVRPELESRSMKPLELEAVA